MELFRARWFLLAKRKRRAGRFDRSGAAGATPLHAPRSPIGGLAVSDVGASLGESEEETSNFASMHSDLGGKDRCVVCTERMSACRHTLGL